MNAAVFAALLLLAKVTLVLATTGAVCALLRRTSAAIRHDLWNAGLAATVALVAVAPIAPPLELKWLPALRGTAAAISTAQPNASADPSLAPTSTQDPASLAGGTEPRLASDPAGGAGLRPSVAAAQPARSPSPRLPAPRLASLFWMIGAALVLLRCAAGHLGLLRLVGRARPLEGAQWDSLLAEAAARNGLRRTPRLCASDAVGTPLTWGALRPVVVLPGDAESWPLERRRAALLHELAHVARADYLAQLAATFACAIYWFHPLVWMALRALRRESERACDDRVIANGAQPAEYAAQLLEVARGAQARRASGFAPAIGMARPSTLEGRLLAVLDESVPRRTLPPRARLAAGVAAALALVPFAGLTPAVRGETTATTVAATTVSTRTPPAVTVHATGSGGAGVSLRQPVVTVNASSTGDWNHQAPDGDPARSFEESVAATAGEELFLDLKTGAGVEITAWDEPRVDVRGRLGGQDWRDSRFKVERDAHGVTVSSWQEGHSRSQSTSHHLAIRVPRRFDLSLNSAGGDLSIDGVEGRFEGHTGGGEITLTHLRGSAHITTGGGTVRVDDCHLAGSVTTGGGPITLSRVSGGLRGSSGSGPVVYREAEARQADEGDGDDAADLEDSADLGDLGDVQVNDHGDISGIEHEAPAGTGRLHISRAGGNVRLAGAPDGVVIHTGGGEIEVGRSAGLVEAHTGGGDITIGPVAGSVRATTGAGRVEVTLADARGEEQSVEISSGNGAVVLILPAGFDGTIDLETGYTEDHGPTTITTPWGLRTTTSGWESRYGTPRRLVRARGTAGSGGGGHVTVRTTNGNVEVRER